MKYHTEKWFDYIYNHYEKYINGYVDTIYTFKYVDSMEFTYDLLKKEFEKYYSAKKDYVSNYDFFKKEFGGYDEIRLLDYEEEYNAYCDRFQKYVEESFDKVTEQYYYDEIKNDISLNAFGIITKKFETVRQYVTVSNTINSFLSSYKDYFLSTKSNFDYELVFEHSFHDGYIRDFKENNRDITIVADDGDENRYTITIHDAYCNRIFFPNEWKDMIGTSIYYIDFHYYDDIKYEVDLGVWIRIRESDSSASICHVSFTSNNVDVTKHKENTNHS